MKGQGKARIQLAENRGRHENELFRSMDAFTTGTDITTMTEPVGPLYSFSDDTLAAGASLEVKAAENSFLLLLPIVGAVMIRKDEKDGVAISAGEIFVMEIKKGNSIQIRNPYERDLVNYLQVWLQKANEQESEAEHFFDLNKNYNELLTIFSDTSKSFTLSLGKFGGRKEFFQSLPANETVFVFVIEGAFEVNGRLLHARDSLSLWDTDSIEAEALSNDAIILAIKLFG